MKAKTKIKKQSIYKLLKGNFGSSKPDFLDCTKVQLVVFFFIELNRTMTIISNNLLTKFRYKNDYRFYSIECDFKL